MRYLLITAKTQHGVAFSTVFLGLLLVFAEIRSAEGVGEKLLKSRHHYLLGSAENYPHISVAELSHYLTAYAAGSAHLGESVSETAYDCYCGELALALADRFENGGSFSAVCGRIRRVFNVTAKVELAAFSNKCRTYLVI